MSVEPVMMVRVVWMARIPCTASGLALVAYYRDNVHGSTELYIVLRGNSYTVRVPRLGWLVERLWRRK